MTRRRNGTGALLSPWDPRNWRLDRATARQVAAQPEEFTELKAWMNPLGYDQGFMPSCVGWSCKVSLEVQEDLQFRIVKGPSVSAWWIYQKARELGELPDYIRGAYVHDALKILRHVGATTELCWPTPIKSSQVTPEPCETADELAEQRKILSYYRVDPFPEEIKAAIMGQTLPTFYKGPTPVIAVIPVLTVFSDARDTGWVEDPPPDVPHRNLHAVNLIGWRVKDGKEYWQVQNSWGKDSGDDGIYYIPTATYPIKEAWVVTLAEVKPAPEPKKTWWEAFIETIWKILGIH
jgi:hypothetical protein